MDKAGQETVVKDAGGQRARRAELASCAVHEDPTSYLTLDHTIQAETESVLQDTIREWHAKSATAIVLDPHTGGVLAMATEPGYDANNYPSEILSLLERRTGPSRTRTSRAPRSSS